MLKITEYADKLLEGLDEVDFPERVKIEQKIGLENHMVHK